MRVVFLADTACRVPTFGGYVLTALADARAERPYNEIKRLLDLGRVAVVVCGVIGGFR